MRATRPAFCLLLLAALGACGDESVDDVVPADEDDVFHIVSEDDQIKLGLTEEVIYFRLSDAVLRRAHEEIERERAEQEGLAGAVASAVAGVVSKGLRTRVAFDLDNIRDIRWEDGRMTVDFTEGEERLDSFEIDDESVLEKFSEEDVRTFIDQWNWVRSGAP